MDAFEAELKASLRVKGSASSGTSSARQNPLVSTDVTEIGQVRQFALRAVCCFHFNHFPFIFRSASFRRGQMR